MVYSMNSEFICTDPSAWYSNVQMIIYSEAERIIGLQKLVSPHDGSFYVIHQNINYRVDPAISNFSEIWR